MFLFPFALPDKQRSAATGRNIHAEEDIVVARRRHFISQSTLDAERDTLHREEQELE